MNRLFDGRIFRPSIAVRAPDRSRPLSPRGSLTRLTGGGAVLLSAFIGCDRAPDRPSPPPTESVAPAPPKDVLVFPNELRAADDSVNEFVARAMSVCAAGAYEPFRLLWSAREDPMPQAEFDEGWRAVREIRIQALERILLSGDGADRAAADNASGVEETAYVAAAQVLLDPERRAGRTDPQREVVLLLIREHGEWRLARAPKAVRAWIRSRLDSAASGDVSAEPSAP